jgi:thymidine kinase
MGLSIIMGNMFSGKTSELIRRLKRLKVIGKNILVVNSAKDTRSPEQVLKTHDHVNKSVILAGLDADSFQCKFGEILDCVPLACDVTKLSALCMCCNDGTPGPFTKRIVEDKTLELIGGSDMYIAVCREHL